MKTPPIIIVIILVFVFLFASMPLKALGLGTLFFEQKIEIQKERWEEAQREIEKQRAVQLQAEKSANKMREKLCLSGQIEHCRPEHEEKRLWMCAQGDRSMCKCGDVKKRGWEYHYKQRYAYEISDCDQSFVALLENENGNWSADLRHNPALNAVGVDWGLCGINDYWHPQIVNHERFIDFEWQVAKCLEMYRNGVTFYGAGKPAPNIVYF